MLMKYPQLQRNVMKEWHNLGHHQIMCPYGGKHNDALAYML